MLRWCSLCLGLLLVGCKSKTATLEWELVAEYPHDTGSYTQGLEFYEGFLLESGGQYKESKIRHVDPLSGKVLKQRDFPASIFAEGCTVLNGQLWLLTWKDQVCYVLDPRSFELIKRFNYTGEGWGICTDGKALIMSDGSSTLTVRDPKDFSIIRKVEVTRDGAKQKMINELEWVDGVIYANIYQKNEVVRIDPQSGKVTGVLDLTALRGRFVEEEILAEVLNGIACDPKTGNLWVTGKYWPKMFEIKLR